MSDEILMNNLFQQRDDLAEDNRRLRERIKRLEEAGDEVVINYVNSLSAFEIWRKAKEVKP